MGKYKISSWLLIIAICLAIQFLLFFVMPVYTAIHEPGGIMASSKQLFSLWSNPIYIIILISIGIAGYATHREEERQFDKAKVKP